MIHLNKEEGRRRFSELPWALALRPVDSRCQAFYDDGLLRPPRSIRLGQRSAPQLLGLSFSRPKKQGDLFPNSFCVFIIIFVPMQLLSGTF